MSSQPASPHDAESSAALAPPGEPRLLTRRSPHGPDQTAEQHHLHELAQNLDDAAAPGSQRGLTAAIRRMRGRQLRDKEIEEQIGERESGAGRRWLLLVAGLFVLAAMFVGGASLWMRHALHAALPQIDGTLQVPGLHAAVEVTRDAHGVPSITAQSLDDLLFAQGFVTAQDRLWQMDALRRNAAGELAEVLGSGLVDHDRRQRYLQVRAAAERAVAVLAPEQLAQLDAYARGVNAAITAAADHLPIEFRLLHYRPAPWTPRDSLLVSLSMAQDLGTSFSQKLNREALSAHLPAALAAQLYPTGSWRDRPPTQPPLDLTTPRDVPEVPLDPSQTGFSQLTSPPATSVNDLLHVAQALRPCGECRAGSNNWAVAASRSASGAPLFANDMHLSLSAPDIWYEAGLHVGAGQSNGSQSSANQSNGSQSLDAAGFTLPGVPFIIVGRNAHVAWGFTNLGGDVQDVRIEHMRGTGARTEYQRADGSWASVGHRAERVAVRGGRDVLLDVLTTTAAVGNSTIETPVISPLYPSEHRMLSLAWTVYDAATLSSPFLAVNQAADGPSLVAALASFGAPSLNLVWADGAGHIGYHAVGRVPVRGPAVHHPRAVEPLILPENVSPEDQRDESAPGESGETESPQARLAPLPRPGGMARPVSFATSGASSQFLLAGYQRARRRPAAPRARLPARRPTGQAASAARLRGRRQPVIPSARAKVDTGPSAFRGEVIAPAAVALDYTIGSPIAPGPVDALEASQQWSGYVPFSDLPAAQDPANGVLATANSRVTSDDYPYALTLDWVDPYRTERIYKLLETGRRLTPADLLTVQNDVHSELDRAIAQRVAYALDHASSAALRRDKQRLHQAADLLRGWKGEVRANEAAPAVVAAIRADLLPLLIAAQVARHDGLRAGSSESYALASLYQWGAAGTAVELILQHTPAAWLPAGFSNWNDFLASLTEHALEHANAPRDLAGWRYGTVHTIEIPHPLLGTHAQLGLLLAARATSGRYPADGDAFTIKAMARQHGPSERFVADLAANGSTLGNITTGQSGNPASPWFMDQFLPWLRGTSFALPLAAQDQAHRLTLTPAGGA